MGALIDLVGRRFGRLTVKARMPDAVSASGARQPVWGCLCACGRRTAEQGRALRAGRALSCRQCVRDPSRMLKFGTTYVVWWPTLGILKIGRAFRGSRLEMMRQTGAVVLLDARDTDGSWEAAGLRALRRLFDPAFTGPSGEGPHRADRILYRGRGWSECFFVEREDLQLAYDTALRAMIREGNDFGHNPPATPGWRRALCGIQRARAARRGGADGGGAADPGWGGEPARAGAGAAGRTTVSGGAAASGDGACDPARADARGCRAPAHVGGGRARVAFAAGPVRVAAGQPFTTAAGRRVVRPRTAIFTGWGERERGNAGARAGASASARASTGAGGSGGTGTNGPLGCLGRGVRQGHPLAPGTPRSAGCSAHRLSRAPQRLPHALRSLRHGRRATAGVPGQAQVPRPAGDLRGAVGR